MDFISLPNINKDADKPTPKNKILEKAIDKKDLNIIQDWLLGDNRNYNISRFYKSALIPLLVEFLDQPLRIEAIQAIHDILKNSDDTDVFCKVLLQRMTDFSKLVILKGKIDYLKYLKSRKDKQSETKQNITVE